MGSCDDLAVIGKPLSGSVIHQNLHVEFSVPSVSELRSCSDKSYRLLESKVDPTKASDWCPDLSSVDDTGCVSSGEVAESTEAFSVDEDGLVAESGNVGYLVLDEVLASECTIRGESLIDIQRQSDVFSLETDALCSEKRESEGEDNCGSALESVQMSGSEGGCVQLVEISDKNGSCSIIEGLMDVIDDKRSVLGGLENDMHNQVPSSHSSEMPLELIAKTGLPSKLVQREQENTKIVGGLPSEVMEGKSDASVGTEADVQYCNSILQGGEMPVKSSHAGDLVSNSEWQSDQKDEMNVSGLSAETVEEILQSKGDIDCIQVLSSQGCQRALENFRVYEPQNISAQHIEGRNDESLEGPCEETVAKVVEEKSEGTPALLLEENSCNLQEVAPDIDHTSTSEKSLSPHSCQFITIADSQSSKDMPDQDVIASINSSSVAECSGNTDNEGKDNIGVFCIVETKSPDMVSSSSRRNSRRSKSSQKTNRKRVEKKRKNPANVPRPHGRVAIVLEAARMKRSSLSKPARSSVWGSLEKLTQFFEQSNGLSGVTQIHNQGVGKARVSRRSGKQKKMRATGSSRGSRRNPCTSITRIRLKLKVGEVAGKNCLNSVVPEFVDTIASSNATINDYGTELYSGTGLELPQLANGVEKESSESETVKQVQCLSKHPEKVKTSPGSVVSDGELVKEDSVNTKIIDKATADGDNLGVPSNVGGHALEGTIENRCTDPGTSPDSEVIDLIPEAQVTARDQADLHDSLLTSKDVAARGHRASSKRGKKARSRNCILEERSPGPVSKNKAKTKHGRRKHIGDGLCSGKILTSPTSANASSNSSSGKDLSMDPLGVLGETENGVCSEAFKEESAVKAKTCCNLDVDIEVSESHNSKNLHPSTKAMGGKHTKSGRVSKGRSKASGSAGKKGNAHRQRDKQPKVADKCKAMEKGVCDKIMQKVESQPDTGSQIGDGNIKTNNGDNIPVPRESNVGVVMGDLEEQYPPPRKAWVLCDDCHKWRRIPAVLADSIERTNCTWTCKDNMDKAFADCSIPQEKSNSEINVELDISDASGEEDANDARLNYMGLGCRRSIGFQESTFKCISTNEFLHRRRKTQTIDEIMVCHCKPTPRGQLGCADECLNRMLNIECVQGTCPCGDFCSNQQFQRQKYAKLEWFRSGKKGYGLKLQEDISKGHFLIEYVGEVLDIHAYEARQKEYALNGHRHFYFMTLNGSEVIDACAKGNLGRFINHSCDPNCRTEKWMVNGEICIGLFALRDIKKGEEVTFDYNYVRVFGAAAKKCYCAAPQCRGYIGGDPLSSEVIIQGDSDEEFPEPVMLEDGGNGDSLDNMITRPIPFDRAELQTAKSLLKYRHRIDKATTAAGQLESIIKKDEPVTRSAASQLQSSVELQDSKGILQSSVQPVEISHQTKDLPSKPLHTLQQETSIDEEAMNKTSSSVDRLDICSPAMTPSKSFYDGVDVSVKSYSEKVEDKRVSSKSHSLTKVSRSSSSGKKGKVISDLVNTNKVSVIANKSLALSIKAKKLLSSSSNGRSEAVEDKLNELLDTEGGISKRKDASKGYLKLLLLTAASGDSGNGEAIQSNRDLSMILDALLKTKSRAVLIDVLNKNGLRMLHNIMKQYRRDFKKIPILRKLLKVLEYLAVREILTPEHINGGAPCPGMESFRESMLSLTEHDDKQVHQIARNFRDRWIPRPIRKNSYLDRNDVRIEVRKVANSNRFSSSPNFWRDQDARPTEAIDCVKQSIDTTSYDTGLQEGYSAPSVGGCLTNETKPRKRKSRWDQPAEPNPGSTYQHKEQKLESISIEQSESRLLQGGVEEILDHTEMVSRKKTNSPGSVYNHYEQDEASRADHERQNIPEDFPPGFSSPRALGSSYASSTATELPQESVCHRKHSFDAVIGQPQDRFISCFPVSYGVPLSIVQQFGTPQAGSVDSWVIAPAMPFHPFPPLPPFPRDNKDHPPSHALNPLTINQPVEAQRDTCCPAPCYIDGTPQSIDIPGANSQQPFKRARQSSYDLGRRYFRQEKWNTAKIGPPWLRRRNGWGHLGDNSRGGSTGIGIGNLAKEVTNSYVSDDVSCRVEKAGNNFFQHSQHQNHH